MNVKFTFDDNKFANIKIDSFEIKGFDNAIFDGKVIVLGSTVDSELSYESENAIENKAVAKGKADIIVNSVSGNVALFQDGAALPVENLIAAITPVQSGSGDPSPSNVRPITGYTGANIMRTGKNLLKNRLSGSGEKSSLTYVVNADGSITVNGTADAASNLPNILVPADKEKVPAGSYILSGCPAGGSSTKYRIVLKKGTTYYTDTGSGVAFTINQGENYEIYIRYNSGVVFNNLTFKPMIRLATETDDTYEPYVGETIKEDWTSAAGTVYAGSYDAVSGKLKSRPQYASYNGETLVGPWLSSMDVYEEGATPTTGAQVVDLGGTETEYALTPQTVTALVGKNTVWADVGDVFVKYRADTKLYIDNKIAQAISAALNA